MEESKAKVFINPSFLPILEGEKDGAIHDDVNLSIAMYLFTAKKVTLARAAELSGKSISNFIQILIDHNIHWAEYKMQGDETIDFMSLGCLKVEPPPFMDG